MLLPVQSVLFLVAEHLTLQLQLCLSLFLQPSLNPLEITLQTAQLVLSARPQHRFILGLHPCVLQLLVEFLDIQLRLLQIVLQAHGTPVELVVLRSQLALGIVQVKYLSVEVVYPMLEFVRLVFVVLGSSLGSRLDATCKKIFISETSQNLCHCCYSP
jgi:hypothetical protein